MTPPKKPATPAAINNPLLPRISLTKYSPSAETSQKIEELRKSLTEVPNSKVVR